MDRGRDGIPEREDIFLETENRGWSILYGRVKGSAS